MNDERRTRPGHTAMSAALHELIEALDRRVPAITRAGEARIREQAAELRAEATLRILAIAEADAEAERRARTDPADVLVTGDGMPAPAGGTREQEMS